MVTFAAAIAFAAAGVVAFVGRLRPVRSAAVKLRALVRRQWKRAKIKFQWRRAKRRARRVGYPLSVSRSGEGGGLTEKDRDELRGLIAEGVGLAPDYCEIKEWTGRVGAWCDARGPPPWEPSHPLDLALDWNSMIDFDRGFILHDLRDVLLKNLPPGFDLSQEPLDALERWMHVEGVSGEEREALRDHVAEYVGLLPTYASVEHYGRTIARDDL